jgi:hypothetical protein
VEVVIARIKRVSLGKPITRAVTAELAAKALPNGEVTNASKKDDLMNALREIKLNGLVIFVDKPHS